METETKDTIPLWLAVAITVCVALPFGIWLVKIDPKLVNIPIWASFIVWAEYFALGAKPAALKIIVPAYILGVIGAGIIMTLYAVLITPIGNDPALFASCFVGFCVLIYAMKYLPVTQTGSLPFFNGISMMLAVYFTGAFPTALFGVDPATQSTLLPALASLWAILAGLLGAFLGWFNVTIMFPRQVPKSSTVHEGARA
ncbi:MAG: DUF1097 family protein [Candidatus Limnocylindrales bacterium]